jgi:hypothetical protein
MYGGLGEGPGKTVESNDGEERQGGPCDADADAAAEADLGDDGDWRLAARQPW